MYYTHVFKPNKIQSTHTKQRALLDGSHTTHTHTYTHPTPTHTTHTPTTN